MNISLNVDETMVETPEATLSPQTRAALLALLVAGIAAILDSTMVTLAIRTLGTFVAATLVARAAHGHKGLSSTLRWTPIGGGIKRN